MVQKSMRFSCAQESGVDLSKKHGDFFAFHQQQSDIENQPKWGEFLGWMVGIWIVIYEELGHQDSMILW